MVLFSTIIWYTKGFLEEEQGGREARFWRSEFFFFFFEKEWGALDIMHGGIRMTIDPSYPYNAGAEHVGFSPTRQTLPAPSSKGNGRCRASQNEHELNPTEIGMWGGPCYM